MQVIKAARIVERSTPWGASGEACDELRQQIAVSKSPSERLAMQTALRGMEKEIHEYAGQAAINANGVFGSPENLALLCLDLKIFAVTINAELEKRDRVDTLAIAMREFETRHLFPAIKLYAAAVENAKAGKKLPAELQPFCASELLLGRPWREVQP